MVVVAVIIIVVLLLFLLGFLHSVILLDRCFSALILFMCVSYIFFRHYSCFEVLLS